MTGLYNWLEALISDPAHKLAEWLTNVYGIGFQYTTSAGAIAYHTDGLGIRMTSNGSQYTSYYGSQRFSVSDTEGVAAFFAINGGVNYTQGVQHAAKRVLYPLRATLISDADKIQELASALAFIISNNHCVGGNLQLLLNMSEVIEQAVVAKRKNRNTTKGIANMSFTVELMQGIECLNLSCLPVEEVD